MQDHSAQRIGPNAHAIDIPPEHGISITFNVEDLIPYKGQLAILDDPFEDPLSDHKVHDTNHMPSSIQLPLSPTHTEYIDAIFDEQRSSTFPSLLEGLTRFE